jgi:cephalosporin hydroxylase
MDLLIYQEILYETRPHVIIETGTAAGGSALFFASLCDLLGRGEVITVDIVDNCRVRHPRITRFIGSSIDSKIVEQIRMRVQGRSAMVVLDSEHAKEHVLRELELYSAFVPVGHYMVVEDTNIHGHPVLRECGEGPAEAVVEFLRRCDDFRADSCREKHLLSFNSGGFLRRIRKTA